jgi:Nif-specific regulatory protein
LCDQVIRPEDLPERVRQFFNPKGDGEAVLEQTKGAKQGDEDLLSLAEIEGRHIFRVLARTGGNKQAAARVLGIDRTTLQRKIDRYNLDQDGTESAAPKERA